MDERELAIRRRLKEDFEHYAAKCLKLRTKDGAIKSFELNKAQKYIHQRLEEQKRKTGKVRAIILKGRQQGCCFTPSMRVLTSTHEWVALDEIKVGDKLVACDEDVPPLYDDNPMRKLKVAIVEAKVTYEKPVYSVYMSNGTVIDVTGDHRMLTRDEETEEEYWGYIDELREGDVIRCLIKPGLYKRTADDEWMCGVVESSAFIMSGGGIKFPQLKPHILSKVKAYLHKNGIRFRIIPIRSSRNANKIFISESCALEIDGTLNILALTTRLQSDFFSDWCSGKDMATKDEETSWPRIIRISQQGSSKVIDLQTSTKTFICEGLVSHNSTYIGARLYHQVTHRIGVQAFILAHEMGATNNLFAMAKRFYENTPQIVRPEVSHSNSKELVFGALDSGYKLGTAENKNVGRSSTIQLAHFSECGFWNNAADHAAGIMRAIPDCSNTEVIMESTANGVGGYFHQEWQKAESGESEFEAIFVPWFWQEEYKRAVPDDFVLTSEEEELMNIYGLTLEQINWRRNAIVNMSVHGTNGEKLFKQEFPCNAQEAFQLTGEDNFIPSDVVMRARKCTTAEKYGPLVLGVDVAREGPDRTSIIRRQGRVAYGLESYLKMSNMEVAGLVHTIIEKERPVKVCIDVGAVGAGVVDRLLELGHRDVVVGINSAWSPLDKDRYANKRAEMWALTNEWLHNEPVSIPDSDTLHADLCGVKYKGDSNARLLMESKASMRSRGVRSSDEADALCLTFALPDGALLYQNKSDDKLQSLADSFNRQLQAKMNARNRYYDR